MTTVAQIDDWLSLREDEHIEFKEAKQSYSFDRLVDYCAALANEGGGRLVLGVSDQRPRRVVGSAAYGDLPGTTHQLLQRLRLRVISDDVRHPDGRVVVFSVPSRPVGVPVEVGGRYLMRAGGSLTGMTPDTLRRIFEEAAPDYSAEICPGAGLDDLDPDAILAFQKAWARKARNDGLLRASPLRLLEDAELVLNGEATYAALVLFGMPRSLGRLLPQAEVVFEHRTSAITGPAQHRADFRQGFFAFFDQLWRAIEIRNDMQHYREGLFVWDVPTFHEATIREAVLNAIAHRDYRLHGSVFVRQYPRRLELVSPGGLPPGITVENILWRQSPRNRRICEALQRCGLVERSGQGMNLIFEQCIRHGNPLPSFEGTDAHQVAVAIHGVVRDPRFLAFLEQVGQERLALFNTEHFLVVDLVHREQPVPENLQAALRDLLEQGTVERPKRGRLILSRRFHAFLGRRGTYTRRVGLDRDTNKMLLLKHIKDGGVEGSRMDELMQVLPQLSRHQVAALLRSLRSEGQVECRGRTRSAKWFPTAPAHAGGRQAQSGSNMRNAK